MALLLLTGITELHQFLKIPFLVSHYQQHRKVTASLTLLDFLRLHYSGNHHPDDGDDAEDQELPFQSPGTILHTDIPLQARLILAPTPDFGITSVAHCFFPEGHPCMRSYSIFHPPRF